MGCFDFTYADNGKNQLGSKGYLYLTDKFVEQTGIKSPLAILYSDPYGDLTVKIHPKIDNVYLDIFAIYGAMIQLERPDHKYAKEVHEYTNALRKITKTGLTPSKQEYASMEKLEDSIRELGISIFYQHIKDTEHKKAVLTKLGNQPKKEIIYNKIFTFDIPLILSRKKLPIPNGDKSFNAIAKNWQFVTGDDPNQGFKMTSNHYVHWEPENK